MSGMYAWDNESIETQMEREEETKQDIISFQTKLLTKLKETYFKRGDVYFYEKKILNNLDVMISSNKIITYKEFLILCEGKLAEQFRIEMWKKTKDIRFSTCKNPGTHNGFWYRNSYGNDL